MAAKKVNLGLVLESLVRIEFRIINTMHGEQHLTDRELIAQYRAGDQCALASLVRRYHKSFCEKAYWVTKDKNVAKDVAQDSWMTIIKKLHTLENLDRFKSWALRIVYTKAVDGIKHIKREDELKRTVARTTSVSSPTAEQKELKLNALLAAIKKLPTGRQNIIRLFYAEEYSITQISSLLGIPRGTVKSRLFTAREQLKLLLKNINDEK